MQSMSSIAMIPLSRTDGRIETTCSGMPAPPLLDRYREFLLDLFSEVRSRIVRAERNDFPVRGGVVDHVGLLALDVGVGVAVAVHSDGVHRLPGDLRGPGLVAHREHPVQDV